MMQKQSGNGVKGSQSDEGEKDRQPTKKKRDRQSTAKALRNSLKSINTNILVDKATTSLNPGASLKPGAIVACLTTVKTGGFL